MLLYIKSHKYLKFCFKVYAMTKKGFTIKLDEELWKEFSIKCIKKGKTKADILEEMVKEFIKKA